MAGYQVSHPVHGIAPSLAAPVLPDWGRTVSDSPTTLTAARWIKVKNRTHPAFSRVQDQF